MNKKIKGIIIVTVVALFGITTLAYADWGMGYGRMGQGDRGPGWHHRGGYGPSDGYAGNLSADELEKLDRQRAEYFKATEDIRQKLYEKELEMRSELAKKNPDTGKASKLQSEISKLQSQIDQKSLDYEMKARKTAPNYSRGYRGHGPMMGYGSRGGGYCMW